MIFRLVEMITFVFYHVCICLFLFAINFVQHIGLFHLAFLAAFIHRLSVGIFRCRAIYFCFITIIDGSIESETCSE